MKNIKHITRSLVQLSLTFGLKESHFCRKQIRINYRNTSLLKLAGRLDMAIHVSVLEMASGGLSFL